MLWLRYNPTHPPTYNVVPPLDVVFGLQERPPVADFPAFLGLAAKPGHEVDSGPRVLGKQALDVAALQDALGQVLVHKGAQFAGL